MTIHSLNYRVKELLDAKTKEEVESIIYKIFEDGYETGYNDKEEEDE